MYPYPFQTYFRVDKWTKDIQVDKFSLRAECHIPLPPDLLLSNGYKLSDLTITVSVFRGDMSTTDREKAQLAPNAIGGFWWLSDEKLFHGWFFLPNDTFSALWTEVTNGSHLASGFSVFLSPVEAVSDGLAWTNNPINISDPTVSFERPNEIQTIETTRANDMQRVRKKKADTIIFC
jgi:hypothetical protein